MRVLVRRRIYGSQVWYVITCVNLHVFRVNWLRLFLSVFCTLIFIVNCSSALWMLVDWPNHVKSLYLLVYFLLSSYSWSFEVCFASFRIYTYLFSVLTSGIRARFNDEVKFIGSIIDDWTRLERGVHHGGCSSSRNFSWQ